MPRWHRSVVRWTAVLSAASVSLAHAQDQTQSQPPANICEAEAGFRQFDFWIGEWNVFNNVTGALVGENHIEAREGRCVLVEHWTAHSGPTGMSINFYDNITKKWRQVWVAQNYSIDIAGELNPEGALVLEGQLRNFRFGRTFDFRGTWTPNPNGTVRQLFERKNPQTGEWQVWFDGRYERKG